MTIISTSVVYTLAQYHKSTLKIPAPAQTAAQERFACRDPCVCHTIPCCSENDFRPERKPRWA